MLHRVIFTAGVTFSSDLRFIGMDWMKSWLLFFGFALFPAILLVSCTALLRTVNSGYDVTGIVGEPKENGYLLRIESASRLKNVQAWIGQDNWLYITIPDTNVNENRLSRLRTDSVITGVKFFRYENSVQLTVKLSQPFGHVEVLQYPDNDNVYVVLYKKAAGPLESNSQ